MDESVSYIYDNHNWMIYQKQIDAPQSVVLWGTNNGLQSAGRISNDTQWSTASPRSGRCVVQYSVESPTKGKTLEFETSLQGTPFDWRLTLKKGNASRLLHGTDRRPGKGGQGGEMVIEEHVVKKL